MTDVAITFNRSDLRELAKLAERGAADDVAAVLASILAESDDLDARTLAGALDNLADYLPADAFAPDDDDD